MTLRHASPADRESIRAICLEAFDASENEQVAKLATELLIEIDEAPPPFTLIAEEKRAPIGTVAFSPVRLRDVSGFIGYILAPLAVRPDFQGDGIGKALAEAGLQEAKRQGARMAFVYGDPAYYGRFGFGAELAQPFDPPFRLQYPDGWQAIHLAAGTSSIAPGPIDCVKALRRPELW